MKRHTLYEIDLERKTAFCTVCGYTEIYVPETRKLEKPKVRCLNRARELWLESKVYRSNLRDELREQPDWKPRHSLSEIDPETGTAVCAKCGPTDISIWRTSKGDSRYLCKTKVRDYARKYKRSRYISLSTNIHALSEIDEERETAVCAKCGPVKMVVWHGRKNITIRRCINTRTGMKQAQLKAKVLE